MEKNEKHECFTDKTFGLISCFQQKKQTNILILLLYSRVKGAQKVANPSFSIKAMKVKCF